MKKFALLLCLVSMTLPSIAGRYMYFRNLDQSQDSVFTSDVDSVKFEKGVLPDDPYTSIKVYLKDGQIDSQSIVELDSIYFGNYIDDDDPSNFTFDKVITCRFLGNMVFVSGDNGIPSGVSYEEDDNGGVIITSTEEGVEYVLMNINSSIPVDGAFKLYSTYKSKLTLNGLNIVSQAGSAINIQSGKRTFINMVGENTIFDTNTYPAEDPLAVESQKACIFSEGELLFEGEGTLSVTSQAKHAISSDDYIRMSAGTLNVTSQVLGKEGIKAKESFVMDGGTINIDAADAGIQVKEGDIVINDGDLTIECGDEGLYASADSIMVVDSLINSTITINGGNITIDTGLGDFPSEKAHGIKTFSDVTIAGGNIDIESHYINADGVNTDSNFYMKDGTIIFNVTDNCYPSSRFINEGGMITCNEAP